MSSALATSASGAVALVLLQLGSRLITFTLNQALLRWTTPAAFGTASIQLEFLLNTILFLSREGMRSAMLRQQLPQDPDRLRSLRKTARIPFLAGCPVALILAGLFLSTSQDSAKSQHHFHSAVALYVVSALLELASEPYFLEAQLRMNFKLRVSVEGSAVIVRSLVTLASIIISPDSGLLAFALGQLVYSVTLLVRYAMQQRVPVEAVSSRHVHKLELIITGIDFL
jgi:oligosaccharide translocation protein RFT1